MYKHTVYKITLFTVFYTLSKNYKQRAGAWWHTPLTLVMGRQVLCKSEDNLVYVESSRLAMATYRDPNVQKGLRDCLMVRVHTVLA